MRCRLCNCDGALPVFALLSINTSAGPKEILTLRLKTSDWKQSLCLRAPRHRQRLRSYTALMGVFKAAQLAISLVLYLLLPGSPFRICGITLRGSTPPRYPRQSVSCPPLI